jgi:PKD repeat protein
VTGGATIRRSVIASAFATGDALHGQISTAGDHAIKVDSSILLGGAGGANVAVVSTGASTGATTLDLRHVTAPGTAAFGLKLDSSGAMGALSKSGNITANITGSIVHGSQGSTAKNYRDVLPSPLDLATNIIDVKFANSDANAVAGSSANLLGPQATDPANPHIDMGSPQLNPDAQLFDATFHLTAASAAKDKGGPLVGDESTTDIDGEPRENGASDIGADEFTNKAPEAKGIAVDPASPKSGQVVTVTVAATDANAGDVLTYGFDFGDGTAKVTSPSPAVQHIFAKPGTYNVQAAVVDSLGVPSNVLAQSVTVLDGQAPSVRITGAKLLVKRHELRVRGGVGDPSGIAKVEISLTRSAGCRHYTGSGFVRTDKASCTANRKWIAAQLIGGTRFEITTNPDVKIPKGKYVLRARATDKAGNVNVKFSAKAGTLVKFAVK